MSKYDKEYQHRYRKNNATKLQSWRDDPANKERKQQYDRCRHLIFQLRKLMNKILDDDL
jgi:hypothetical protein